MTHIVIAGSTNESQPYYLHMCMCYGKGQLFLHKWFWGAKFHLLPLFSTPDGVYFLGGVLKGIFTKEPSPHVNFKQVDKI